MIAILTGLLVGALIPWQTVCNTRLREALGSPFAASMVSFVVGTLGLALVAFSTGAFTHVLTGTHPVSWWMFIGGGLGVVALTGNIVLFPRLGAVETVVLPIGGQIATGLVIDHWGLFSAPRHEFSLLRLVGASLVLLGVLTMVGIPMSSRAGAGDAVWGYRVAGVGLGAMLACQSAINGRLGAAIGSPLVAALISFAVGALVLAIVNLALGWRPPLNGAGRHHPWWMWVGGFLGAVYVVVNAWLVPAIGAGLTVMVSLAGLMTGSLAVDRVFGRPTRITQVLGVVIIVAGVAVIHRG